MSIRYIREYLISNPSPTLFIPGKGTDQHAPIDYNHTSAYDIQREVFYEEPVSIHAFTSSKHLTLQQSVPVEVDRHWSGDNEDCSVTARPRLTSEGSRDTSSATTQAQQNTPMHSTTTSVQERDHNTGATSAAPAHKQEETDLEDCFLSHPMPIDSEDCVDDSQQQSIEKGLKGELLRNQLQLHGSLSDEKYYEEETGHHETWSDHQGTNQDLATSGLGDDSPFEAELGLPHLLDKLRNGKDVKASFVTPGSSVGSSSDPGRTSTSPPSMSRRIPDAPLSVTPPTDTRHQHTSNGSPPQCGTSSGNPAAGTLQVTTAAKPHDPRNLSASSSSLEGTMESQATGFGTASSGSSYGSFRSVSPDMSDLAQPHQAFCEGPQEENGLLPWQLQS